MRLTVRHKLLLLLGGSLTAAMLLVAVMLTWLIGRHHDGVAGQRAHDAALEVRERLLGQHERLAALASALAAREEVIASLSLLARHDANGNLQKPALGAERRRLAQWLQDRAGMQTIAEAYDGQGRPLRPNADPAEAVQLPAGEAATMLRLRRSEGTLVLEVLAPVAHTLAGMRRQVGWLRLGEPFDIGNLVRTADRFGMHTGLLFSHHFDAANPFGLSAEQLNGAPDLLSLRVDQADDAARRSPRGRHFLHVTSLDLADGERAWLIIQSDAAGARAEQRRAQDIVLKVLAGSLLLAIPFAGWLERRWISRPFETIRSGVHEYALGNLDRLIDLRTGDEFESLAEDFNLLAVALRVREIAIREAEERWQFALECAGHGVWDRNLLTGQVFFSPQWKRMLGYADDEIANRFEEWESRLHPDDRAATLAALEKHIAGETPTYAAVFRMRYRNGDWRWILARGKVVERDPAGKPLRLIGTQTDITERVAAEQAVREAATVFEATSEAILITDAGGVIKRVNTAFTTITGYAPYEVVGKKPALLKSGRHDAAFYAALWRTLLTRGHWQGEIWNRRKNGEIFPVWETISAVRNTAGEIIEFVSLFADITQKKRSEEEIAYRANYDALTGLPNRTLMTERLNQAIKQARREDSRIAVMFLDLDFFKQVNDTLGHAMGDRLLQAVAERMRLCVRETDTIARQGGDEFVILLANIEDAAAAGVVADKILAQLCTPFTIDDNEIHIGASIGITLFPDDGRDIETLFRNADLAMYRAKESGRNNAQFFEMKMTTAAIERRALEADLRGAIARGEFAIFYQPVVELASGRIVAAEALLRWRHPQRGLVPPDRFIPLAEETGLIREIGAWVFSAACGQLARWRADGYQLTLAINVSVRQLPEAFSVAHILATLAEHDLSPRQIVLEITEGVLLADSPAIQEWFLAATDAGLSLAIDDFGTGYSSLAYLKRFPVHHIKIDKSFVRDMTTDPADRALIEAILAMAHSLGLAVVAEGVETTAQADLLLAGACEYAQGYLYGKPDEPAVLERLLAAQASTSSQVARS